MTQRQSLNRLNLGDALQSAAAVSSALFVLLLGKLVLIAWLYRSGFVALTSDDFGRVFLAADWARAPYFYRPFLWLPFHMYLNGILFKLVWELLWAPRVLTIIIGLVSIVLMYHLTHHLFENRLVGLSSALLLAVNPVHSWLSAAPLTEMYQFTLNEGAILGFILYAKNKRLLPLGVSALCLALANGFRYEAWIFSALFGLTFLTLAVTLVRADRHSRWRALPLVGAVMLIWIFPLVWLSTSYIVTGNFLYSIQATQSFLTKWYGSGSSFIPYLQVLFHSDPWAMLILPVAAVACLLSLRKARLAQWYIGLAGLAALGFALMQRGQDNPESNLVRYLAPFLFLAYPIVSWFIVNVFQRLTLSWVGKTALASILLAGICFAQLRSTFNFVNDPASEGLSVGLRIRSMRDAGTIAPDQKVMIELTYWGFVATHIGANDLAGVIYDREYDPANRQTASILSGDPQTARDCLASNHVSFIVVKDPQLRAAATQLLGASSTDEINGYSFFSIPSGLASDRPCPYNLTYLQP